MVRPLNWIQWSTLLLLFVVPALTVLLFFRIQDVQHHQNDALHTIICSIESFQARSHHLTVAQKHAQLRFWTLELQAAHLRPCAGG